MVYTLTARDLDFSAQSFCGRMWVLLQVNDFMADAIVSQLLLLDAQDPTKVCIQLDTQP